MIEMKIRITLTKIIPLRIWIRLITVALGTILVLTITVVLILLVLVL